MFQVWETVVALLFLFTAFIMIINYSDWTSFELANLDFSIARTPDANPQRMIGSANRLFIEESIVLNNLFSLFGSTLVEKVCVGYLKRR